MTVSMHKTLAALKLPTSVPALLGVAQAIIQAMTGNPSFPGPAPSLAAVATALAELRDAEVTAQTRARGTVALRDEKRAALISLLLQLKAYVQRVAEADPDRAAELIQGAGMNVKRSTVAAKPPFAARPGATSGSVRLVVRAAGDRARYDWAWSTDGGTTWRPASSTIQSRTVISGLAPASMCSFRYRVVTKTGEGDWSEPLAFVVR
jgi:hypothetical protein